MNVYTPELNPSPVISARILQFIKVVWIDMNVNIFKRGTTSENIRTLQVLLLLRKLCWRTMSELIVCALSAHDWQLIGTIPFLMTVSSVFREGFKDLNCVSCYGAKANTRFVANWTLLQNVGYKLNIQYKPTVI